MKMVGLLVVAVCLLAGCGGGPCVDRTGAYKFTATSQSGNCEGFQTVTVFDSAGSASGANQCSGSSTASDDNCSITTDATCVSSADGSSMRMAGKIDWSPNGASGSGTVSADIRNAGGGSICYGVLSVTYEKL